MQQIEYDKHAEWCERYITSQWHKNRSHSLSIGMIELWENMVSPRLDVIFDKVGAEWAAQKMEAGLLKSMFPEVVAQLEREAVFGYVENVGYSVTEEMTKEGLVILSCMDKCAITDMSPRDREKIVNGIFHVMRDVALKSILYTSSGVD